MNATRDIHALIEAINKLTTPKTFWEAPYVVEAAKKLAAEMASRYPKATTNNPTSDVVDAVAALAKQFLAAKGV